MNEHIEKGNEALERKDLQTAKSEFQLAMREHDTTVQRIARNRLTEIDVLESSERETEILFESENGDSSGFGWLSHLGYKVGSEGLPQNERRSILLDAVSNQTILKEERWGQADSQERVQKLMNWLEYRINSKSGNQDFAEAVRDWSEDLQWLSSEYAKQALFKNKS